MAEALPGTPENSEWAAMGSRKGCLSARLRREENETIKNYRFPECLGSVSDPSLVPVIGRAKTRQEGLWHGARGACELPSSRLAGVSEPAES